MDKKGVGDNLNDDYSALHKATIDRNYSALHKATIDRNVSAVKFLIENGAPLNIGDVNGWTALHHASSFADHNSSSLMEALLDHVDADVNIYSKLSQTPLHLATFIKNAESVEFLLGKGANPDLRDDDGNTPLHIASTWGYAEIVKLLLIFGADMDIENIYQETPYKIAADKRHVNVTQTFKAYLAEGTPFDSDMTDSSFKNAFQTSLLSGFYFSHAGKISLLGNEGAGKTTITRFLVGKRPQRRRQSTQGIEVHVNRACIDRETNKLVPKAMKHEDVAYANLLRAKTQHANRKIERRKSDSDELLVHFDYLEETTSQESADEYGFNDNPAVEKTLLQRLKSMLGIKHSERVKITSDMILNGAIKARKKGINLNLIPVIILDFAGQEVFYATHQSFLSDQGVYVIVINGSLNLDHVIPTESYIPGRHSKPTTRGYIIFWISSILAYSKGKSNKFPQILLCCTHKDQVPLDQVEIQRAYIFDEVTRMFEGTEEMCHLVLQHRIFINGLDQTDPDMTILKKVIVEMVYEQPTFGSKMPKPWIHLEMVINTKADMGSKVLSLKAIEDINKENPMKILSREEIKLFLQVHHSQGNFIYFPLPGLQNFVVISPPYVIDAFKSIITDKRFCTGNRLSSLLIMNRDGILKKQDIDKIWKRTQFFSHKTFLIDLMCHLDILSEPTLYDKNNSVIASDFFYVPCMITTAGNPYFFDDENLAERSIGLSFKFHTTVLPSAIAYRFIASCIDMWEVETKTLFSGIAVLVINRSLILFISVKEQRIDAFLIHSISRNQIIRDLASSIRESLYDTLLRITNSYRLSSGNKIDSNYGAFHIEFTCGEVASPCYFELNPDKIVACRHTGKVEDIDVWFVKRSSDTDDCACETNCEGLSEESLEEKPSELQMGKLVLQIGWTSMRAVLIRLGLFSHEIESTEHDFRENVLNVMFICLLKWQMKCQNGSLSLIKQALESEGHNIHVLCKVIRDKLLTTELPYDVLERPPTDKDIDRIANIVIEGSLLLCVNLEIEATFWRQLREEQQKIVNINKKVLYKWRDEHAGKPKCRELAQALCNIGINIDYILSDVFK